MGQTDYSMSQDVAVAGLLASAAGAAVNIQTYNNPVDAIRFGHAVSKVSGDENGVEQPDAGGAVIVGVALRDESLEYNSAAENQYPALSAVAVLRRGQAYCYVEETVTPDAAVFVRHTANGGLTRLGAFRTDADGGNAVALATAKFITGASAGGYAIIDFNIA